MADIDKYGDVTVRIQGSANDYTVEVDGRGTTVKGLNVLPMGEYRSTPPSLSNTQLAPLQLTSDGLLKVVGSSTRYRPRFYTSKTDISISTSDTTLASLSFDGKLDGITINFSRDQGEVILIVDGTEILRVDLDDLNSLSEYMLYDLEPFHTFYVSTSNDGKQIFIKWAQPVDVLTSLVVKGRRTGLSIDMEAILIQYRVTVT